MPAVSLVHESVTPLETTMPMSDLKALWVREDLWSGRLLGNYYDGGAFRSWMSSVMPLALAWQPGRADPRLSGSRRWAGSFHLILTWPWIRFGISRKLKC